MILTSDAFISPNSSKQWLCFQWQGVLLLHEAAHFFFIMTLILIDINSNIGLHSHGDLLPRTHFHIRNVWFSQGCWEEAWAHPVFARTRSIGLNGSKLGVLCRVSDSTCEVISTMLLVPFLKIIVIFSNMVVYWKCRGKMKHSMFWTHFLSQYLLLGDSLINHVAKVQGREAAWRRSHMPDCSLSFHVETIQASSWDLLEVGDGLHLRGARSQAWEEPAGH